MSVLAGLRVLVVEDEYLLARQLERALQRDGADVVAVAPSVAAALAALAAGALPDVAVLDLNLAGEKAYPVAAALRAAAVPFAFASGYDAADRDPPFADAPHLNKPLTMATLRTCLARLTGRTPG
ncbi:response regulator [Sphingomonas yunnanensis]|uniref:response regulator n=1 Tax=Sphingomonas yunnanensis TaxID=310400 RepID=UPI001CA69602|nr:response regulator [Sphingomonas yunnanensis]